MTQRGFNPFSRPLLPPPPPSLPIFPGASEARFVNDPGKMFVGGLSRKTTQESLGDYFSHFGDLAEVVIMKDPVTQMSRGFGFVTFVDPSRVNAVLGETAHVIDGKRVDPKVAEPRGAAQRCSKIFVGGLSADTNQQDLKGYFEEFGRVRDAQIVYDKVAGHSKGFGFVTFYDYKVVNWILRFRFHNINGKMVECKIAVPMLPRGGDNTATNASSFNGADGHHYPTHPQQQHVQYLEWPEIGEWEQHQEEGLRHDGGGGASNSGQSSAFSNDFSLLNTLPTETTRRRREDIVRKDKVSDAVHGSNSRKRSFTMMASAAAAADDVQLDDILPVVNSDEFGGHVRQRRGDLIYFGIDPGISDSHQ